MKRCAAGHHAAPAAALGAALFLVLSGCGLPLPFDSEETPYDAGWERLEAREYSEALAQFTAAEQQGGDDAKLYRAIGIAKLSLGDYDGAEEAFTEALSRCGGVPGDMAFDLSYYLARTYTEEGRAARAIEVYNAILSLRPKEEDARYLRGLLYLQQGDHDSAGEDFQTVLDRRPRQYDRILSIYDALTAAGYASEGKRMLTEILAESGDSMTSYEKGRFSYYLGNLEDARSYLEDANNETSARSADRIPIVILLGEIAQDLGDDSYAISVYRRFLQDDQSQASVYNALGVCEMRMGSYSDALSDFQIGLSLDDSTQNAALLRNMAAVYEYMGNFEIAAERMEEYLALVPTDEGAQRERIFLETRVAEATEEEEE